MPPKVIFTGYQNDNTKLNAFYHAKNIFQLLGWSNFQEKVTNHWSMPLWMLQFHENPPFVNNVAQPLFIKCAELDWLVIGINWWNILQIEADISMN